MMIDIVATINKHRATLADLPLASEAIFPGCYPWSPISTSTLTNSLRIDRGNWGTWRNRGLTPDPLPPAWFKRGPGNPSYFRIDAVRDWLARRTGEKYDALADWRRTLRDDFGADPAGLIEAAAVRRLAAIYGRAAGPRLGDITFTASGFDAYMTSLGPNRG